MTEREQKLRDALQTMVNLFDHAGLNGLMLSAKRHGWTREMVDERIAACRHATKILAEV